VTKTNQTSTTKARKAHAAMHVLLDFATGEPSSTRTNTGVTLTGHAHLQRRLQGRSSKSAETAGKEQHLTAITQTTTTKARKAHAAITTEARKAHAAMLVLLDFATGEPSSTRTNTDLTLTGHADLQRRLTGRGSKSAETVGKEQHLR
jgi:hypothetical protein